MPSDLAPTTGPAWVHLASMPGIGAAIARAVKTAIDAGDKRWAIGSGLEADRAMDFRALVFASMWMFDELSVTPAKVMPSVVVGDSVQVMPRSSADFSSSSRYELARIGTQRTWSLLMERLDAMKVLDFTKAERILTRNGDPVQALPADVPVPKEAGAAWVLPAIGMVLGAVTVVFLIERSAQIIDRSLARQADAAAMVRTQAGVLSVLNDHREAEKTAGKELPLTPAELEILKRLQGMQDDFSKRNSAGGPFPELFPSGGQVTGLGVGVILAVAAVVALVLLKGR